MMRTIIFLTLNLLISVPLLFADPKIKASSSYLNRLKLHDKTIQKGYTKKYALHISTSVTGNHQVHLKLSGIPSDAIDKITIYRSFNDLGTMQSLDLDNWPITRTVLSGESISGEVIDSFTAHNVTYSYYAVARLKCSTTVPSNVTSATIPDIFLPQTKLPISLFIDKCHYFLELRFNHIAVKRYPLNTGTAPGNRKLYFDRRSTPEGIYKAHYLKYTSDYHKAIGIDYPNQTDKKRYYNACRTGKVPISNGKPVAIGGSIQIHGGGIGNNWTWGCLAMRNNDLDELFALKSFKAGIPITIVGSEFTRDSIPSSDTM